MKTLTAAILKDPSISDEEAEMMYNEISSRRGGPVVVLLDPSPSLTPRDGESSQKPWPVSERLAARKSR